MPSLAAANYFQREIGAEDISDFEFGTLGLSISESIEVLILKMAVESFKGSRRINVFLGWETKKRSTWIAGSQMESRTAPLAREGYA
ncbi:MAG: hypothetical protein OXN84_13395 [Albidovulum sp.]|nr:hypothetical protein [Albidovulum sp.]